VESSPLATLEPIISGRSTSLRADAQQNRDAILAAATEALLESADISMNAIAQRAGVGTATLHRNFPTKEALILAVYSREVDQLSANATELLAKHPAEDALRLWVKRLAQYAMTKRGLAGALQAAAYSEADHFTQVYDQIFGALSLLLQAAEDQGAITPGTDPHDVLLSLAGLWQMNPAGDWQAQAMRLYNIVFRGLTTT
jgi:AcrR family transcriptional regulator